MKTAIILGRSNGVGLDRDAALLGDALRSAGMRVSFPRPKSIADALAPRYRADLAFHLERVAPWWWQRKARTHFLIPNQERFPQRLVGSLRRIDRVLCKSHHATEIFSRYHAQVEFTGFTSEDRLLAGVVPDYHKFFHLAGRSTLKNTALLLELWERHPEWPRLTVVQHPHNAPKRVSANVEMIREILDDERLRLLQNSHGIHLCPSLSEGWGHYLAEAMSTRALVLTTDAAPMNELVTAERGLLVKPSRREARHLGENFHIASEDLEGAIESLRAMPDARMQELAANGRVWFEQNHVEFRARLAAVLA
jgi:glycosyltransferase involved in cell wall biosynthesis